MVAVSYTLISFIPSSGQAVKFRRPETKFWLAKAPVSIFVPMLQRYIFFIIHKRNNQSLFVKKCLMLVSVS